MVLGPIDERLEMHFELIHLLPFAQQLTNMRADHFLLMKTRAILAILTQRRILILLLFLLL